MGWLSAQDFKLVWKFSALSFLWLTSFKGSKRNEHEAIQLSNGLFTVIFHPPCPVHVSSSTCSGLAKVLSFENISNTVLFYLPTLQPQWDKNAFQAFTQKMSVNEAVLNKCHFSLFRSKSTTCNVPNCSEIQFLDPLAEYLLWNLFSWAKATLLYNAICACW